MLGYGSIYHTMRDGISTSCWFPNDLFAWVTTQATIRDSTRSALLRALIRAARAEFQGGPVVGLASAWPPLVEPPSRKRLPHRHRHRTGRLP